MSLGDVNHDGLVDVVVGQSLGVVVVPASGGGAFGEALHFAGNGVVGRIAIGDMDGDGALDLAASNHSSTVLVLRSLLVE